MKLKFSIKGLDCPNCAKRVEKELSKITGIKEVTINFMTQKMIIEVEENIDSIIEKINKTIKEEEPDITIELM